MEVLIDVMEAVTGLALTNLKVESFFLDLCFQALAVLVSIPLLQG